MENINKKYNAPNILGKTVVLFTAILFVISSVMTIENVSSIKDNELKKMFSFIEPGGENWWNSSFDYRKLITINHSQVNDDLTNFPILVYRYKDSDLSSHAQIDGDDICFVLYSDNSTKLNHEIESYSNGTGWIWVNVTSLSSSTNTKLWMYYGNATCGSQENIVGTWNSGYVGVWHLTESAAGTGTANVYDDSTSNNNNGTDMVSDTGKDGIVAYGQDFDGDDDYITVPTSASLNVTAAITMEAWIYPDVLDDWHTLMRKRYTSKTDPYYSYTMIIDNSGGEDDEGLQVGITTGGIRYYETCPSINIATGVWNYCAGVYDQNRANEEVAIYINGSESHTFSPTSVGDLNTYNTPLLIGCWWEDDGFVEGELDEIRISNINRKACWIGATYNTINNPSTFLTVGSEEPSNRPPHTPSIPYPAHGSTSVNVNVDLSWTGGDPDGDPVTYDVYLGTNSTPPKVASNLTTTSYDPGILELDKTYYWKIIAWDNQSTFTEGPVWWFSTGTNQPPSKPIILSAPTFGRPEIQLDFSAVTMDPEGDQIYYLWDWGDGELSGWLGPFVSGQTAEAHHTWDESGEYEIKVKTKDSNDAESYWSEAVQIIIENNPPDIVITKPLPNMLYFGNQPLFPFLVTMVIGPIDIEVNASDDLSGMDRVEFYIKDVIKKTVTSAPYTWLWGGITFGIKLSDIKVIAYDNAGNNAYDTIMVWRFL